MEEKTPLQKVLDIFIDYYGEDKVDLQDDYIYVYFPHVTITNENDRSVDITELYVKINVDSYGKLVGTFTLNRSEYTAEQWYSDYMHSHTPGINKDSPSRFSGPCLGTGPIKNTCLSLNVNFDEDIWRLFVFELDKYVHTESVSGRPYRYLERIGTPPRSSVSNRTIAINANQYIVPVMPHYTTLVDKFLPYVIQRRPLSFGFTDKFIVADSPYNIVVKLSNMFIEWYNNLPALEQGTIKEDMLNDDILIVCKVNNETIIRKKIVQHDYSDYRRRIGTRLWTFKGNPVRLNITNIPANNIPAIKMDDNCSILLHPNVVMYLVNRMLRIINYRYGSTESFESNQEPIYL